tara:strand:+ start:2746 stop:2877 length:132 start_codon:yes stop_codon:yes gene_type:complete
VERCVGDLESKRRVLHKDELEQLIDKVIALVAAREALAREEFT